MKADQLYAQHSRFGMLGAQHAHSSTTPLPPAGGFGAQFLGANVRERKSLLSHHQNRLDDLARRKATTNQALKIKAKYKKYR